MFWQIGVNLAGWLGCIAAAAIWSAGNHRFRASRSAPEIENASTGLPGRIIWQTVAARDLSEASRDA
jgi:hypothetical protein